MRRKLATVTLSCLLSLAAGAIKTNNAPSSSRGAAFNNIISNYFTTDPFFKAKQRLHLPPSQSKNNKLLPHNAKQDRMSSIPRAPPTQTPIRLKLGPPIQILPTLASKRLPITPPHDQARRDDIVVGDKHDHVIVPAPLLAATGHHYKANKDKSNHDNAALRRQSFSQLIATTDELHTDDHQQRFENFPASSKEGESSRPTFKVVPDSPHQSFEGDSSRFNDNIPRQSPYDGPPLVTFKNAEDLRYQNDYFEIPSPDDFENEIFQDFDVPKLKPEKREYYAPPAEKYAEPLAYMNPLDKHHNQHDVEIFETPSKYPYKVDKMSYSHYKSSPHFVDFDKSPSPNEYRNTGQPQAIRHKSQEYSQQGRNDKRSPDYFKQSDFDIPKLGPVYDEHVYNLPDDTENEYEIHEYNQENRYNDEHQSDFVKPSTEHYRDKNFKREIIDYPNYNDYNEVDYDAYHVPADLPPPPGIIEMQHDSVFAGNFDVPKLGVAMEYKPPEMVYNEMFENRGEERNSFSDLLPMKHSRSLTVTPSPFLPTPSKPRSSSNFNPRPRQSLPDFRPQPGQSLPEFSSKSRQSPPDYSPGPKQNLADYSHLYRKKPVTQAPHSHQRNYFKPSSPPSLTFEPDLLTNEIDTEGRELYERLHGGNDKYSDSFLNNIVENEIDYADFGIPQAREEPPARPETILPPASGNYQRSNIHAEVSTPDSHQRSDYSAKGPPRPKRYQSVDYTPQDPYYYDYQPQKIVEPYPPEPYIPSSPTPPPYHYTPSPYYPKAHYQPTPAPEFFKHQAPEFPVPDNFLYEEPPQDYYNPDYYGGHDYKTYELDTYSHDDYSQPFLDIPKLGPDGNSLGVGNYNQFVNVAGPESFEHGHVRGNPEHQKQEYTRREGRHFKSQVTWSDGDEGYGKHYFEYNH